MEEQYCLPKERTVADSINREIRKRRRTQKLDPDLSCQICSFDDALQCSPSGLICYECANAMAGRATVERQHPLGRKVDLGTIGMPGNMHRVVDDMKYDWPECVRKNVNGDPLLWIAALVLSAADFAEFIVHRARRLADWLVLLWEALRQQYGEQWREALGLPRLWD
jgi:hypothetical protein